MRVLGIDPGVALTGWAIIETEKEGVESLIDFGVIETEKIKEHSERLLEICNDMEALLGKYKPEYAGVETLLFCNNAKTAISVGEARGVVLLCIQKRSIPIYEFTPLQVKNSISGYGGAGKKQVQESIKLILGLEELPKPDDAADAIAVAICTKNQAVQDKL
jgi:crossover junction endodeoxyribonuclease RuvC